jgi:hypothetical protein
MADIELVREGDTGPERSRASRRGAGPPTADPTMGALVRRLAEDGRSLIHQEVDLAKSEVQDALRRIATNGALIGGGAFLLALGGAVLIVFVVLALGRLLGGQYWLSTLLVGGVLSLAGTTLLLIGRRGLRRGSLAPRRTLESLDENRRWAQREAEKMKQELSP